MTKKFDDKMSFDLAKEMKLDIYQEAYRRKISRSEVVRMGVKTILVGSSDILTSEIEKLDVLIKDKKQQYSIIKKYLQKLQKDLNSLKNERTRKLNLIDQSNIVYTDEEFKIKTIILDVFATNKYKFNSHKDLKEKIKFIANNTHADISIVLKLINCILNGEITLRELIEKPIQHIVDAKEVQHKDTEEFIKLKESLWIKYGEYIEKQEEKQQKIDEEKNIIHKSENERLQYVIKKAYNTNYRTQNVMEGNIEVLCQKYKLNSTKTLNIINQIYQNKLDYLKVIKSDHIYESYCRITPDKKDLREKTTQPKEEQKLTPIQDMILHLNRKQPLTEIKDVNLLKSQIRQKCYYRSDIKFRELWNILIQIIQGKISVEEFINSNRIIC